MKSSLYPRLGHSLGQLARDGIPLVPTQCHPRHLIRLPRRPIHMLAFPLLPRQRLMLIPSLKFSSLSG